MLRRREPLQLVLKALRRPLLFPSYWRALEIEPLLDELLDLPSGNKELAGYRGPDHRIWPGDLLGIARSGPVSA
jgi:hypothetical protein